MSFMLHILGELLNIVERQSIHGDGVLITNLVLTMQQNEPRADRFTTAYEFTRKENIGV